MKTFLLLIIVILYYPIYAQNTGSISGEVLASQDGSPLLGAVIIIVDEQIEEIGTETDSLGRFELININPGKYNLKISKMGYEPVLFTYVVVSENKRTKIHVYLKPLH